MVLLPLESNYWQLIATGAPIFGQLSDLHIADPRGKRRPFLLIGAPLMALGFLFLWIFPPGLNISSIGVWGVAIIYWIAVICFSIFNTFTFAPYIAMLPEISSSNENRIMIAGVQGIFNLSAIIIGTLFPLLIKSFIPPENIIFIMSGIGLFCSVLAIITIYLTYFHIHEPSQDFTQNQIIPKKTRISLQFLAHLFLNMFKPLKNQNFRNYQINSFIFNAAMRVPMVLILPVLEIVIGFDNQDLIYFLLITLPVAMGGYFLWIRLTQKFGLVRILKLIYKLLMVFLGCCLLFLLPLPDAIRRILGQTLLCGFIVSLIATIIIPNPLIAKLIDEEVVSLKQSEPNFREEDRYSLSGKFYGVHSFIINLSYAVTMLWLGIALTGNEENAKVLSLLIGSSVFVLILAHHFLNRIRSIP
jgi:Na+/melibiose symporter-like transporter